jgi:putative peptide zinc metalloprotease protein
MTAGLLTGDRERRLQVRLRLRSDLVIVPHKYEGKTYYVVKDPVSLRYYRFKDREHFMLRLMDGRHTLDDTRKAFDKEYRPDRLELEDLEGFAQQLLTTGLADNDSPAAGRQLYEQRCKKRRQQWLAVLTNILYIKLPLFDPDRLLTRMLPWFRWVFTAWNVLFSIGLGLAAVLLVLTHFDTFLSRLPSAEEFFSLNTVLSMWVALGIVKVIHEFGHGLSCKAFGGEVHEMGALFLCLSPALYCNVSDAWTLPSKWQRMVVSFAGIYVELIIAALATFVWWNTPGQPFINHMSLMLMIICSVNTVVFNGNPLMRFDGYYVLADWLEVPNLSEKANRYLKNLFLGAGLGVEVPPQPVMELRRRVLFVSYAFLSWAYRWVVTFVILYFLTMFLKPYKLGALGGLLAAGALASMLGWPLYRLIDYLRKRGRLPDMKPRRVQTTLAIIAILVLLFLFFPVPWASQVRETGLVQVQPQAVERVFVPPAGGNLESLAVRNGQPVREGEILARFRNVDLENKLGEARSQVESLSVRIDALQEQLQKTTDAAQRGQVARELARAEGERAEHAEAVRDREEQLRDLELRAPRSGLVLGLPTVDEIGKHFQLDPDRPFCRIGDPAQLRVLMPVSPADYRLLHNDLAATQSAGENLRVTICVQGRGTRTWQGQVSHLPEADARDVPPALSSRYGGPVAIQNDPARPDVFVPVSQYYLVGIDVVDPDAALCPGTLAQVKVHCRWQPCAWWVWRAIASTFDIGL